MKNFDFDLPISVKSFKLSVSKDGTLVEKSSNSNELTNDMKKILERVRRGNKIYIEDIKVLMPSGEIRKVASMQLTVTS